jgi:phosphoribosylamine--glycine ligase
MDKKILILGNSAKEYALAKQLSENNEVYVASGSPTIAEFANCVDIRDNSVTELLEFVMENGIDLTIPFSNSSLSSNIVEVFNNNQQLIFAPSRKSLNLVFDKALAKKVLYKLRIPTPKFGIFEKQNLAYDYIKNLKNPFVIKTNEPSSSIVFSSTKSAKFILDSMFASKSQKIIVEDYVYGTPFAYYTITDGYKALPLGSSILYKHSLEGDGGQLTSGMGACSPNYKLSLENEYFIMDNIIYPTLDYLEIEGNPYVGILGVNGVLTEDGKLQVLGYIPAMQDCDCNSVLKVLDADLIKLFKSCCVGSFSDEVDYIGQHDLAAVSVVLTNQNKNENLHNSIQGLDTLDDSSSVCFYPSTTKNKYLEHVPSTGPVLSITSTARTVNSATDKVYCEINSLSFDGMKYRKDICKTLIRE